jgi:sulfur relay protein TusB/DsrH
MKILHIIKKTTDTYAWDTVGRQRKKSGEQVGVLLLHDAVFTQLPEEGSWVFACREDVTARGIDTVATLVGYENIVEMILDADSVICW